MGPKNASVNRGFPGFVQQTKVAELFHGDVSPAREDNSVRYLPGEGEQIVLQGVLHFLGADQCRSVVISLLKFTLQNVVRLM
jgi:hypothetical protein